MGELRTPETDEKYRLAVSNGLNDRCFFCDKSRQTIIKEFAYFTLVKNDYPYDKIAEVSDMLYPNRHVKESGYTTEEINELNEIKINYLHKADYNYLLEGITKSSIPEHAHYHAIKLYPKLP